MTASQLRARYWRIVYFFARVTASFIFWDIFLFRIGLGSFSSRRRAERYRRHAVRFRALAIRMGGLMIKVGQFLSSRLDVLPQEITDELAGLQDEVPAENFAALVAAAEADIGEPLAGRYDWIDSEPLAAASLGQVHRARLCASDAEVVGFSDVVVKVQRPYIDQIVEVDLAALRRVGGWLKRYKPVADRADVPALVEEFSATTHEEIDYLAEGRNAETFAANFAENPRVHVPRVVWPLTSRRVLTLEDVSAIKLSDYDAIEAAGISRADVASLLIETYMQQILTDGFFHADPHPGNIFITPAAAAEVAPAEPQAAAAGDASSEAATAADAAETPAGTASESATAPAPAAPAWRITFVDFGMVGRVPENLRSGLREVLIAVGTQDAPRLVSSYKTLGVLLPSADMRLIEAASVQLFDRFWGMSMADLRSIDHSELARFALQFRELLLDLPFQLPENLLLLGRTVAILSGMATGLSEEFNLWTEIAPFANKLIADEGGTNWQTWLAEATKIFQTLITLPGRADRVLSTMERGELSVRTPMLDLRVRRLERSVNRISGALVFSAMLIAGALLRGSDPRMAGWLMGGSVLPLLWLLFAGRGGHPGR